MTRPTERQRPKRPRRWLAVAGACALLGAAAAAAVVAVSLWRRPPPGDQLAGHHVPLGVEEAVIIRYAGPRLVARPYRRGASVNLRVATEEQLGSTRVYDVRYVVNLPGEFELTDYLAAADGSPIDDLPTFKVRGLSSLTKDIETRIREIEDVGVHIWHGYYEMLAVLGVFWVAWLAGLIFIGRPKRPPKPPTTTPQPTVADQVAHYLAALARGELSVDDKARLEALLLRHWREHHVPGTRRMAAACRAIERSDAAGRAYASLQAWLHDPEAEVGAGEIIERCAPSKKRRFPESSHDRTMDDLRNRGARLHDAFSGPERRGDR